MSTAHHAPERNQTSENPVNNPENHESSVHESGSSVNDSESKQTENSESNSEGKRTEKKALPATGAVAGAGLAGLTSTFIGLATLHIRRRH